MKKLNEYEIVIEQIVRRTITSKAVTAEVMRDIVNNYGASEAFSDWPEDQSKSEQTIGIVRIVRANS